MIKPPYLSTASSAKRLTSSTHSKPKSNTRSSLNGLKVNHRSQLLRIVAKCSAMRKLSLTSEKATANIMKIFEDPIFHHEDSMMEME